MEVKIQFKNKTKKQLKKFLNEKQKEIITTRGIKIMV